MAMRRYGQYLAAVALMVGMSAPALAQQDLRIGSGFGDAHSSTRAIRDVFAPQVEKSTNGRYKVSVFPTSQLGQAPEMVNQTQQGITFGVYVSSAFFNSQVPQLGVTNLPFMFPTRADAFRVLDGPVGQELAQKLDEKGLVLMGFMELGFRHLTNSKLPITKPEDVRGLKIRLQNNPVHIATFRLLGANPVAIDASEMFAALRQGVADGQENPYAVINIFKLNEANQKYATDSGHFYDILIFAASKSVLARFSAEDRKAIIDAGRAATLEQRRIAETEDAANLAEVKAKGVEVTVLTPAQREAFRLATAPVYQEMAGTLGKDYIDRVVGLVQQK